MPVGVVGSLNPCNMQNLQAKSFKKSVDPVLTRPLHPPKVELVKNKFFQDHHTLPKHQLLKISSFRTTTSSQSTNCQKAVLSWPPNPPKLGTVKISSFNTTTPAQSINCIKLVLSRLLHPPKVSTVKNQFFQDHNTLPM